MKPIHEYVSIHSLLSDLVQRRKESGSELALSSLAKYWSLSPSMLSQAIQGKKKISKKQALFIARKANFTLAEKSHFTLLVEHSLK